MNPKIINSLRERNQPYQTPLVHIRLFIALFYLILIIALQSTLCLFQMRTNHPE